MATFTDKISERIVQWGARERAPRARSCSARPRARAQERVRSGTRRQSTRRATRRGEGRCASTRARSQTRARLLRLASQVIAEEILPHVIFVLFLVLFAQIWYWSDDLAEDEHDDDDFEDEPAHADGCGAASPARAPLVYRPALTYARRSACRFRRARGNSKPSKHARDDAPGATGVRHRNSKGAGGKRK